MAFIEGSRAKVVFQTLLQKLAKNAHRQTGPFQSRIGFQPPINRFSKTKPDDDGTSQQAKRNRSVKKTQTPFSSYISHIMTSMVTRFTAALLLLCGLVAQQQQSTVEAFCLRSSLTTPSTQPQTTALLRTLVLARDEYIDADDNNNLVWIDEDDDDDEVEDEEPQPTKAAAATSSRRWNKLNARIKERIIQEGQARAIANKKKREPAQDKKRRR